MEIWGSGIWGDRAGPTPLPAYCRVRRYRPLAGIHITIGQYSGRYYQVDTYRAPHSFRNQPFHFSIITQSGHCKYYRYQVIAFRDITGLRQSPQSDPSAIVRTGYRFHSQYNRHYQSIGSPHNDHSAPFQRSAPLTPLPGPIVPPPIPFPPTITGSPIQYRANWQFISFAPAARALTAGQRRCWQVGIRPRCSTGRRSPGSSGRQHAAGHAVGNGRIGIVGHIHLPGR